jgi:hypothetical protein
MAQARHKSILPGRRALAEAVAGHHSPGHRKRFRQELRDVDGEPIYDSRFCLDVLSRRLKIMLPPGTLLSWQ